MSRVPLEYAPNALAPADRSPMVRWVVVIGLLLLGLSAWLHFGAIEFLYGVQRWGLLIPPVLAVLTLAWGRWRGWMTWMAEHRHFPRRWRIIAAVGLLLVAAGLPLGLNLMQGSDLHPAVCDELSYCVQSQLILNGQLWSEAHPLPDFFTTFQVVAAPAYGSIYFPGTALWMAPWMALDATGGLSWIGNWLAISFSVMLAYLIVAELLDDWAGLLTAAVIITVPMFRAAGFMQMGQAPVTLFGLLVVFSYLRWRSSSGPWIYAWALLAGTAAAWGMLTRPVDALAWALPVLLAVAFTRSVPLKRRGLSLAVAMLGILPFAAMQLPFNKAMTGSYLRTPFSWYAETYLPGTGYGFSERPLDAVPPQATAHFQLSYRVFTRPFIDHANRLSPPQLLYERLEKMGISGATHGLMLLFIPLALPVLIGNKRLWLMAAPLPIAALLYLPYGFFLHQYTVASIPSMVMWMVLGVYTLIQAPQRLKHRQAMAALATGVLLVLSTRGLPWLGNIPDEDWYRIPELRKIDAHLAALPGEAVVFISPPDVREPTEAEAVYNLGVTHPDEARVIRAHDLGGRNVELVEYYAQTQPDRIAYHYQRGAMRLTKLGPVAELANLPHGQLRERFEALSAEWRREYAQAIRDADSTTIYRLP